VSDSSPRLEVFYGNGCCCEDYHFRCAWTYTGFGFGTEDANGRLDVWFLRGPPAPVLFDRFAAVATLLEEHRFGLLNSSKQIIGTEVTLVAARMLEGDMHVKRGENVRVIALLPFIIVHGRRTQPFSQVIMESGAVMCTAKCTEPDNP
jgi:hypothetical protein